MDNITILIVEDDKAISRLLGTFLKGNEFNVIQTDLGQEGVNLCASHHPDLILLDLGLPDIDGTSVTKKIREWSEVPIVIISARESEKDKVDALELGADDYITKPFSEIELLARIRALLRRSKHENTVEQSCFSVGNMTVDFSSHVVTVDGAVVQLTAIEFKIIHLLCKNAGKVLTHNYIISKVWGVGGADSQTLRVFIAGIRRKIEKGIGEQRYIKTEINVGYRMNND